jgi:hypothetical protein
VAPFVLLALALALIALGATAVAAVQVLRGVRRLRAATQRTTERLAPLLEELQAEAAVAATESEALQERIAALTQPRRPGSRTTGGAVQ